MSGITNNNTPPTANTNRDNNELTQQKSARALAFYQNNLELADPLQLQINRPQQLGSSSARVALQYARTTQLSVTLQQQLATLDPSQFRITSNPTFYPPVLRYRDLVPTDVGPLNFWLDAYDSGTVTLSGGTNVVTWSDKSGNGRNATGVNNPTYNSSTAGIVFNPASSQYFTLPDGSFPTGDSSYSILFIFNPSLTSIMQMITGGDGGGGQRLGIRSGNSGTGTLQTFWIGYDLETSNTYTTGTRNFGATYYASGSTRSLWINFTQGASDTPGTRSQTSTKNAIGTLIGLAGEFFSGQMHEIIVCGVLTTTQRQQLEGYLAWKWGLQGSLPSNHPYKAAKPQVGYYT